MRCSQEKKMPPFHRRRHHQYNKKKQQCGKRRRLSRKARLCRMLAMEVGEPQWQHDLHCLSMEELAQWARDFRRMKNAFGNDSAKKVLSE